MLAREMTEEEMSISDEKVAESDQRNTHERALETLDKLIDDTQRARRSARRVVSLSKKRCERIALASEKK